MNNMFSTLKRSFAQHTLLGSHQAGAVHIPGYTALHLFRKCLGHAGFTSPAVCGCRSILVRDLGLAGCVEAL